MPSSENAREYVKKKFGAEIDGEFYHRGDYWYCRKPEEKYETNGIRAIRDMEIGLKPTTYFLQLIEDKISKNRVDLGRDELDTLLNNEMIERSLEEKGYVALFYGNRCIGCGFYKDNLISTRIPKGRAQELLEFMK